MGKVGRSEAKLATGLFRARMDHELEKNAHKGEWLEHGLEGQLESLLYHVCKLIIAAKLASTNAVAEYAADVGNEAMFVSDLFGMLDDIPDDSARPTLLMRDVLLVPQLVDGDIETQVKLKGESDDPVGLSKDILSFCADFIKELEDLLEEKKAALPSVVVPEVSVPQAPRPSRRPFASD